MTNQVEAGIFSFTPAAPVDDGYLQWHLLDHMPEQYQLPGIVLGHRWTADADHTAARLAAEGRWAEVANVVNYLVSDPVAATLDGFMALGRRLAEVGRMPASRPSLGLSMLGLLSASAAPSALVSSAVIPYRPHRGVLLVVEQPQAPAWTQDEVDELLDVPGVAGLWSYGPSTSWQAPPRARPEPVRIGVLYLDADPLETTTAAEPLLRARWARVGVQPLFAGPLRSMIGYEVWP